MTTYTVGLRLLTRTKALTIEAEDALLAALKIKLENPEALITYVRKSNRRGDRRHPHEALQNKKVAPPTSRQQLSPRMTTSSHSGDLTAREPERRQAEQDHDDLAGEHLLAPAETPSSDFASFIVKR
jgi:hypothetical protein